MINLLRAVFIIVLFIVSKAIINKFIAQKARKDILKGIIANENTNNNFLKGNIVFQNISIALGIVLLALLNGYDIFMSLLIGMTSIALVYGMKAIKQGWYKKQVLQDLLNVSECLRVQISSQIPLGKALRSLPELCLNKEFAALLTNIYLEYELSKFIILDSAEALQRKFNYSEIRIFISALNQQIQGASAIEAFDNLISVLREWYIEFMAESTKSKMAVMTMGVFIIVLNIAALGIYPVAVEAFNAINIMLK